MRTDRRRDFLLQAGGAGLVIAGGFAAVAPASAAGKLEQTIGIYELDQFTLR